MPVLADPSNGEQAAESTDEQQKGVSLAEATRVSEEEEREQAEWLLSPEAIQQREASREAFGALPSEQAQSLLLEAFPQQLRELNSDPARVLSELEIEEPLGTYGARISDGDEAAIVESSVPVQSDLGEGRTEPVDLGLERSGALYVPQNPLTRVELPGSATDPIVLHGGVQVELPTSSDHDAVPLGDQNLFIPETRTATDTLIAPIAGGVEVFEQLRSPESPEEFRFVFGLPRGASLQESAHGVEVLAASGDVLEEVPMPTAVDAQGTSVPVTMSIEGEALVFDIAHRSADVAYPLLLDPRYNEGYEAPPFSGWVWSATAAYGAGNSPSSLLAYSKGSSYTYGANTWGQWEYNAPGETVYIEDASFSPIYFYVNACQTSQPHGYVGIYNVYSGSYVWPSPGVYSGGNISGASYYVGGGGTGTRKAVVGIGTGSASSTLKCAHEMWVGGVTVQENDPENPSINSVTGIPGGWFDPAKVGNATVSATDQGFGVDLITMANAGANGSEDHVGCTGMWNSRCPRDRNWTIAPPYKQGERQLRVSAEDPTGKVGEWATTTKVDATKPEIELSGQLAAITKEEGKEEQKQSLGEDVLGLPVYNLHVKATDGTNEKEAIDKQSGLKALDIYLDGVKQKVPWESPISCAASSCKIEGDFQLQLAGVSSGEHKLIAIAIDQVGFEREREIDFEYFPATGMKDDYVMQRFPLPDGNGGEEGEEDPRQPELAVNVANGNLVFHQRDVEVSGPAVDLEVERFYNSQLPKAASTEWGQGWTLAQTPELELEKAAGSPPEKAPMVRTSGVMQSPVGLPTETDQERFDAKLQATVTKEAGGGYEVADESGETSNSLAFDSSGRVTELRTPGYAKVKYSYEGGDLSEIAVDDPASTDLPPVGVNENLKPPLYAGTVGSSGSGPGQFEFPEGIAVDPTGNFYVSDAYTSRIEKFNAKGEYLTQFGEYGSGDGQLNYPRGIAIDDEGNLWVVDGVNKRVEKFSPEGKYLDKFGEPGEGNGQFGKGVRFLAIDSEGNIWVTDTQHNRVEKFNSKGEYLDQFGEYGSGNGRLDHPFGLAVAGDGKLLVVDNGNNRIEKFNIEGKYVGQFGDGQLEHPQGLAVDSEGNVWVADGGHDRIEVFDSSGRYLTQFGSSGSGSGQFGEPVGISIDGGGDFLIADPYGNRVQKWVSQTAPLVHAEAASAVGETGATLKATVNPRGLDTHYSFEYGITSSYGASAPVSAKDIGSAAEEVQVSQAIEGLKPWVIYHYRVVASNAEGTSHGEDQSFTTWGQWTLESPPLPQAGNSSSLTDVSCTSATSCLAVGYDGYATKGIGESWNGEKWSLWNGADGRSPTSVSCGSPTACWALAGEDEGMPVIERWYGAGGSWSGSVYKKAKFVVPEGGTEPYLYGISCTAEWECTAVGSYVKEGQNRLLAARLIEKQWTLQSTPALSGAVLTDLSCTSSSACIAVGYQTPKKGIRESVALRWNGTEWSSVAVPAPNGSTWARLNSVSCSSATSCQAIGSVTNESTYFAASYDGSKWTLPSFPSLKANSLLTSLSCTSSSACLAVGSTSELTTLALGWDGLAWSLRSSPTPKGKTARLGGVACVGPSFSCATVGWSSGSGETAPLAERLELRNQEATTNAAIDATAATATLTGVVNPHGLDTHYSFEYGPTRSYGTAVPAPSKDAGAGIQDVAVSNSIAGLEAGRLYHYRLVATSEIGTTYGQDKTFTTPPPSFAFAFGSQGSGEGQFTNPAGVATDVEGNVYIADEGNHRVVEFDSRGDFVSAFGKEGSGEAQLTTLSAIAVGPDGYIYVADSGQHKIKRFKADGEFVSQFGAEGTADSQFGALIGGLAVDKEGVVWVADSANHRVERFDASGKYLSKIGSEGIGNGQFASPRAIAIDGGGNVWVVDLGHERVEQFSAYGTYQRQFGKLGKGAGELSTPAGIATDAANNVWVSDSANNRLEEFNSKGEYLSQFGEPGAGETQFDQPSGLAIDPQGSLLIANNQSRLEKWFVQSHQAPNGASTTNTQDDPSVDVDTSAGLVGSVEGDGVEEVTYAHNGQLLTAVAAPSGDTKYEYDAERLTKVTLPNGTWGKIEYEAAGRVKSVSVSVEGAKAKTTTFNYQDEPSRRTTVTPEAEPVITYDIGADGSVLKWHNAVKPPEIEEPTGSLWQQRGEVHPEPITTGDQNLFIQAHSEDGISSIQFVANGHQIVGEKTCEQDLEKLGTECTTDAKELITNTASWPPGILQLEVLVTDRLNQVASQRLWVNVPYTPAPDSEAPDPPKFAEVLRFREEFGLDLDLQGNEFATNERIFELISLWHNPNTQDGEVARATANRWGVPLRAADAAELEYREHYLAVDGPLIEEWAETHAPGAYAGFYMDNRQGGIVHVGFSNDPRIRLDALKRDVSLVASDRIKTFESRPERSLGTLYGALHDFNSRIAAEPELAHLLTTTAIDVRGNSANIGTTNVGPIAAFIENNYGPNAAIVPTFDPSKPRPAEKTFLQEGVHARPMGSSRLFAGDWIRSSLADGGCTLAFGAYEAKKKTASGTWLFNNYGLTAGHCWPVGTTVYRGATRIENGKKVEDKIKIGEVERRSNTHNAAGFEIDSEAIRLTGSTELPKWIYWNSGYQSQINGAEPWKPGETLCYVGAWGGVHCGPTGPSLVEGWYEDANAPTLEIELKAYSENGASGSPVWNPRTGGAVATLVGGPNLPNTEHSGPNGPTYVTPILPVKGGTFVEEEEFVDTANCEREILKEAAEEGEEINDEDREDAELLCEDSSALEQPEEGEEQTPVPPGAVPGILGAPTMDSPKRLTIVDPVK